MPPVRQYNPGTFVIVVKTGPDTVWELATETEEEMSRVLHAIQKEFAGKIQRIAAVQITRDPLAPRIIYRWPQVPTGLN